MKTYIRRREKNNQLVVLYGGWGTDENVFTPLCNDDFDFILFYNYSADEALVLPEMKTYEKITLIGWSLGVWAAEYLSPKTGIKPDVTIAVNGTPVPADDQYGIPLNVFEGTLIILLKKILKNSISGCLEIKKHIRQILTGFLTELLNRFMMNYSGCITGLWNKKNLDSDGIMLSQVRLTGYFRQKILIATGKKKRIQNILFFHFHITFSINGNHLLIL